VNFIRIVILNYNSSFYTLNLIGQLENQGNRHFEIVVVDNASSAADQENLKLNLPINVHLIVSNVNLGYSGGNNLGMKHSTGKNVDYFMILNDDILIDDIDFLDKMLAGFFVESNSQIIASSPLVNTTSVNLSLEKQIQVRKLLPVFKMYIISFSLLKRFFKNWFYDFVYSDFMPYTDKYLTVDTINGAAFIIKAAFMRANNFLDDGVFLFHEELILGKQIKNSKGICLLNGFVSVKHLQGMSTHSNKNNFNQVMERYKYNSEMYFYKNYYGLKFVSLSIFIMFKEVEILIKRILSSLK
jgi:hypothetical protein